MTKTDYEALAAIFNKRFVFLSNRMAECRESNPDRYKAFWDEKQNTISLMWDIAKVLKQANPKFDVYKFEELAYFKLSEQ